MRYADTSRLGRPFAKDPLVLGFEGRYLLYYSMPPYGRDAVPPGAPPGWAIGIAESSDLDDWRKVGEILPPKEGPDWNGLAAPGGIVIGDEVHLFWQSYGSGPRDAICHGASRDGLAFERDPSNPVFRPTGKWNVGRAIDAEVFVHEGKLYLYYATRDPAMKVQMLGVARADLGSGFGRDAWTDLSVDGPVLRPQLPWERSCIEAPTVCRRGDALFMFYAGGYNNEPQQIGCATSTDAVRWTRLSEEPFLPNGRPGEWNSSESGHPGVFTDERGRTHLFYQGNDDRGRTWHISRARIEWREGRPSLAE